MAQIALSEEQLQHARDEVIRLQARIRRIIEQIKAIDADSSKTNGQLH